MSKLSCNAMKISGEANAPNVRNAPLGCAPAPRHWWRTFLGTYHAIFYVQ